MLSHKPFRCIRCNKKVVGNKEWYHPGHSIQLCEKCFNEFCRLVETSNKEEQYVES